MAEIEKFLMDQLDDAIKKTESSTNCLSNLFKLHDECRKLKDLIEQKAAETGASQESVRREKLYYLNNVMAGWQMLLTRHHLLTPEVQRLVMNLRRSLKQIKEDLQRVTKKDESERGGQETRSEKYFETYRWSSPSVDTTKIHGIDDKLSIMERLLVRADTKNGFRQIGIVGIPGVGKTTLCKVAFNNEEVKKHFLPRIWVCLSKQPKEDGDYGREVMKRILESLGLDNKIIGELNKKGGLQKLLFALRQKLQDKRYLIVLDDVWNSEKGVQDFCSLSTQAENNQDKLANGLPKGHGGTVIITSRSREIAKNMVGEKNLRTLLPLPDKESCWKIFIDAVEKDKIKAPDGMESLKDEILKSCAELPLVAKMMGQIAHEKVLKQRKNSPNQPQQLPA